MGGTRRRADGLERYLSDRPLQSVAQGSPKTGGTPFPKAGFLLFCSCPTARSQAKPPLNWDFPVGNDVALGPMIPGKANGSMASPVQLCSRGYG
jgi:hypothetical protein